MSELPYIDALSPLIAIIVFGIVYLGSLFIWSWITSAREAKVYREASKLIDPMIRKIYIP